MEAVKALLLRRDGLVFVPETTHAVSGTGEGVEALESELLDLGFLVSKDLRAALASLDQATLETNGRWIRATLAHALGEDRPHVPLFRKFPLTVPRDTRALYVRRVLTVLQVHPQQPCVFCGRVGSVHALDPCGHLVCEHCWDGADYSACPICNRRVSLASPFFSEPEVSTPSSPSDEGAPALRLLHRGEDVAAAAGTLLHSLLMRQSPLSRQDHEDLMTLLRALGDAVLPWIPAHIPVRETMATVFATLVRQGDNLDTCLGLARDHMRTATDVLRFAFGLMGGGADLSVWPKPSRSLPRALRKVVLDLLEALNPVSLLEDVHRHAAFWKRTAEYLHPFEFHRRYPHAALAFALLRRTRVDEHRALGRALLHTAGTLPDRVRYDGGQLRYTSWAQGVEEALRARRLNVVIDRLGQRPGELLRRFDHVLRLVVHEQADLFAPLLERLEAVVGRVATPVLMTLAAQLRRRSAPLSRRVFFPRGQVAKIWAAEDVRPRLSPEVVDSVTAVLEGELLKRAAACPAHARAVIDAGLKDLLVPFNERTAARALIAVPRGSRLPIPEGRRLRLFVHWMEAPGQRVDLDLSVSLYDADWRFKGQCDYTHLDYGEGSLRHSGDLTSAPAPLGASEFVDLDIEALQARGIRHLVVIIFSYNDVPFDQLADAFAGFMLREADTGEVFDARRVAQRFDLQGTAKIAIPMLVDVADRHLRWVDVNMPTSGLYHAVHGYRAKLAHLGRDLTAYYGSGARASLWWLACLHAAARCPEVQVRRTDGRIAWYRRADNEPVRDFFLRVHAGGREDALFVYPREDDRPGFMAVLHDDHPMPEGSEVYALYGRDRSRQAVRRSSAGDLVAALRGADLP